MSCQLYSEKLLSKEDVILDSLKEFYKKEENINKIIPIITGKNQISLRVLDWFVTNYAKKFDIKYVINKNSELVNLNVWQDYKNKLKSYNKRFFDPFCRKNKKNLKNKIAFNYKNDKYIITTIGQLNFFRWTLRNGILDYVRDNLDVINLDMNSCDRNSKNINVKIKNKLNYKLSRTIDFNIQPLKI